VQRDKKRGEQTVVRLDCERGQGGVLRLLSAHQRVKAQLMIDGQPKNVVDLQKGVA